jgi:predicted CXXCH cytochrome family protein
VVLLAATLHAQTPEYIGSAGCKACHAEVFERWSKTRMAKVVRDPRQHPEAIIPDFDKPDPLLTFKKDDIAFVYGSKWKQRYFQKVGDDYFPLPAQWDINAKIWRAYLVREGTDWWVPHYPGDNTKRPTGPLCDGCHSVDYNVKTKAVAEWNVGCEKCHGPGSLHGARPTKTNVVNPAHLDFVGASDTCIQCHSQGRPIRNPVEGQYYDWPVGFEMGKDLKDYWQLESHQLGETTFTHFADGTAHKNRMQGNDFVQSAMYTHGVTCFSCHDVHGTANNADLRKPGNEMCLQCHVPGAANGPRAATVEAHTHHKSGSKGNECAGCHMPLIEQTIADTNVRAHTFRFITPLEGERLKIPNGCHGCHADKSAGWATESLERWKTVSPWRMGE